MKRILKDAIYPIVIFAIFLSGVAFGFYLKGQQEMKLNAAYQDQEFKVTLPVAKPKNIGNQVKEI